MSKRSTAGRNSTPGSAPQAITVDNAGEFVSRAMDAWAYAHHVRLDFIRPGSSVENACIESFNGRLRDECLNSHVFVSTADAQHELDRWRLRLLITSGRTVPWATGRRQNGRHARRLNVTKVSPIGVRTIGPNLSPQVASSQFRVLVLRGGSNVGGTEVIRVAESRGRSKG